MKRIKRRATLSLLLAGLLIAGLLVFSVRLVKNGKNWAMYRANSSLYHNGALDTGTLLDRNGVLLASAGDGFFRYADDESVRRACLHAVGDYTGNIGTGALSAFADKLAGYSFLNGTASLSGAGARVSLSIDAALCVKAYGALAGRSGAVLVMDYKSGDILCMVSSPGFDPSIGSAGTEGVYINRALSAVYTPGSVFKIVTLAAALENIGDLTQRRFYCSGSDTVGGETVRCSGSHGEQTIEEAFANSCNVAFAQLSLELGGDVLREYADFLGFTQELSLNGIPVKIGNFDAAVSGSASLAWSGIGQSTDLISPFALLRVSAAIANDGILKTPTLLKGGGRGSDRLFEESTANALADMMRYNVLYHYGSDRFPGLDICAKTGTAEVGDGTSHAWFTGFLRDKNHPLVFAVVVEHGGGGLQTAGAVANTVLQAAVG